MNWLPALGLALAVGAPAPKEAPKKAEPPSIVGEWECVECTAGGRTASAEELDDLQCGYKFTADGKFQSRWGKQVFEGTYTTDSAKDPAQMDCVSDKTGKVGQLIYKVEKDKLTICGAEGGRDRPTKFESPAGTRIMLLTFKRVEKKD